MNKVEGGGVKVVTMDVTDDNKRNDNDNSGSVMKERSFLIC